MDLLVGGNYRFGGNLNAEVNLLTENYIIGTGDVEFPRDTTQFIDDERGQVFLPATYSLGVALRFNNNPKTMEKSASGNPVVTQWATALVATTPSKGKGEVAKI